MDVVTKIAKTPDRVRRHDVPRQAIVIESMTLVPEPKK